MDCKLYIGCVSRNTVDAVIEYATKHTIFLGIIPTRRQADFDGGYVGFDNETLHNYIKSKTKHVILQRDHGGPNQGKKIDDGIFSLINDCKYYDLIHIDPWKQHINFSSGVDATVLLIEECLKHNYKGGFEIATEQTIRSFTTDELNLLIDACSTFNIEYVVIQSGTSLKENINTGVYDQNKLKRFIDIIHRRGLKSKEHNGDYLSNELIHEKFRCGLDAINIAPEFGLIETNCYLNTIGNKMDLVDIFYQLCYDSGQWKKWVNRDFDVTNKHKLIQICGHYVLETDTFKKYIKYQLPNITDIIKFTMAGRIKEILNYD